MADVDSLIERASAASPVARTEMRVTTGPIRGSRKIHVGPLKVAMREIDLERTARSHSEKQLEQMRTKLAEAERNHQAKLIDMSAAASRMASELVNAKAASAESARLGQEQSTALQQALQEVSQYKAEADTLRALIAQFQPPSKPVRRKRNPGGPEGQ